MFVLAAGKARTGALNNPVLRTEGRVTLIDGLLAVAVLVSLILNTALGWWWADPVAGYLLVFYAVPARFVPSSSPVSTCDRSVGVRPADRHRGRFYTPWGTAIQIGPLAKSGLV